MSHFVTEVPESKAELQGGPEAHASVSGPEPAEPGLREPKGGW